MNSFFVNVGPSLSKELPESQNNYADYLQYSTQNSFTFDEVSENDTLKLLCSLKESKSTGPDKINARLIPKFSTVPCSKGFSLKILKMLLFLPFIKTIVVITDLFQFYRMLQKFWKKLFIIN